MKIRRFVCIDMRNLHGDADALASLGGCDFVSKKRDLMRLLKDFRCRLRINAGFGWRGQAPQCFVSPCEVGKQKPAGSINKD
jgi:hypothetical protein